MRGIDLKVEGRGFLGNEYIKTLDSNENISFKFNDNRPHYVEQLMITAEGAQRNYSFAKVYADGDEVAMGKIDEAQDAEQEADPERDDEHPVRPWLRRRRAWFLRLSPPARILVVAGSVVLLFALVPWVPARAAADVTVTPMAHDAHHSAKPVR